MNLLDVDLTKEESSTIELDEKTVRKYIGGVGLAAKILWDNTTKSTDPLSPESPLIFMTGLLTGTALPLSSRYIVAGISPLTNIWGEAHSGGDWADEFRHSGFYGIVIRGQAGRPKYLWIQDGAVEIRDAAHLWGTDTYQVEELLQKETDERAKVVTIGRAGEKLVKIACIMNDGKKGRAAARCGLGALMGSKRLKAIVVRGTLGIKIFNEEQFKKNVAKVYTFRPVEKHEDMVGREAERLKMFIRSGGAPIKNWQLGTFDAGYKLADELCKTKPLFCRRCCVSDMESKLTDKGERHMVWESWAPLGTNCLIDNAEALQEAYTLCNKYGLDTISTGGVVAFAMECYEKGLITGKETGGIGLSWGNHKAMVELVKQIGEKGGLGSLLGEGVRRAAEHIGGMAREYAMHVKGLELPAHDPRAANGLALSYATGSGGAFHVEAMGCQHLEGYPEEPVNGSIRITAVPDLGYPAKLGRFETKGKGELCARTQNFGCVINCLSVCAFLFYIQRVEPSHFVELINSVTGWNMDLNELLRTGERVFNLKRMINVRRGISRKDDTLPPRILTHKRGDGGAADNLPHLGAMLSEYYSFRGWSEEGIPPEDKLKELGLEECFAYVKPSSLL